MSKYILFACKSCHHCAKDYLKDQPADSTYSLKQLITLSVGRSHIYCSSTIAPCTKSDCTSLRDTMWMHKLRDSPQDGKVEQNMLRRGDRTFTFQR